MSRALDAAECTNIVLEVERRRFQLLPLITAFLNDRDDQLQETPGAPSLISRIGAAIVSLKGPNECSIAEIMNDVLGSDFTEVLVRSDSEQAILVPKESIAAALEVNVKTVEGAEQWSC